ncbi:MAG: hypothetical protein PVF45_14140, partial [Anaerolineae bacterium]
MGELSSGILTPRQRLLLKLAVVGGVVCALPVLGFLTSKSTTFPMLVLVAAVAPIGLHFLLQHIELGLVAMLLAGAFVRFRLPTGTASEIVMSFLLCGGVLGMWMLHMVIVEKKVKLRSMPTNLPLFAFALTVFVSMAWGRIYRDPLVNNLGSPFVAIVSAMVIVLLPATFVLVANLVTDERWLQAMVWIFVGGGAVSLFFSLIVDLGIGPYHAIRNLVWYNGLVWINTHGLFSLWYVALSLSLALFNRRLNKSLRIALLAHAAGWLYWGFPLRITWLSGWVPAFTTAMVIVFFRSKKVFVLLALVAALGVGKFYLQTALESESEESGHTRLAAYEVNWR